MQIAKRLYFLGIGMSVASMSIFSISHTTLAFSVDAGLDRLLMQEYNQIKERNAQKDLMKETVWSLGIENLIDTIIQDLNNKDIMLLKDSIDATTDFFNDRYLCDMKSKNIMKILYETNKELTPEIETLLLKWKPKRATHKTFKFCKKLVRCKELAINKRDISIIDRKTRESQATIQSCINEVNDIYNKVRANQEDLAQMKDITANKNLFWNGDTEDSSFDIIHDMNTVSKLILHKPKELDSYTAHFKMIQAKKDKDKNKQETWGDWDTWDAHHWSTWNENTWDTWVQNTNNTDDDTNNDTNNDTIITPVEDTHRTIEDIVYYGENIWKWNKDSTQQEITTILGNPYTNNNLWNSCDVQTIWWINTPLNIQKKVMDTLNTPPMDNSYDNNQNNGENNEDEVAWVWNTDTSSTVWDSSNPIFRDKDGDGVYDKDDNCPMVKNPNQEDSNNDGIGDACMIELDPWTMQDQVRSCYQTCDEQYSWIDQFNCKVRCTCMTYESDYSKQFWQKYGLSDGLLKIELCMIPPRNLPSPKQKTIYSIEEIIDGIQGVVKKLRDSWQLHVLNKTHEAIDTSNKNANIASEISFGLALESKRMTSEEPEYVQSDTMKAYHKKLKEDILKFNKKSSLPKELNKYAVMHHYPKKHIAKEYLPANTTTTVLHEGNNSVIDTFLSTNLSTWLDIGHGLEDLLELTTLLDNKRK